MTTVHDIRQRIAGHTVLFVRGGELIDSNAYRAGMNQQWKQALRGDVSLGNGALEDAATASATAYACIVYRADTVASLPLMVADGTGDKLPMHPLIRTLPTLGDTLWHIDSALNMYGKAYVRKCYNEAKRPTGLQWLHPDCVERVVKADGTYWRITLDNDGDEVEHVIPDEAMIVIDGQALSERRDSPLKVSLTRIGGEQGIAMFQAAFFLNGSRPDGMLIYKGGTLDDDALDQAKTDWKQFQNPDNAHKTFVQSGEWEWIAITPPLVDLAMSEVGGEMAEDICKTFQTNPVLIGAATASDPLSAQSTFEHIERHHIESVSLPRLKRVLAVLNVRWVWCDFAPKAAYTLCVDESNIPALANTNTDNATAAQLMTISGVASYTEARRVVGLPEDDTYLSRDPAQVLPMFEAGTLYADELRGLVGLRPLPFGKGKFVKLNGVIVRLSDIDAYAELSLTPPPAPQSPFSLTMNGQSPAIESAAVPELDLGQIMREVLNAAIQPIQAQLDLLRSAVIPASETRALEPGNSEPRATDTAIISASLNGNAFVRYAKRTLSDVLTQRGVLDVEWVDESTWSIPLMEYGGITPAQAETLFSVKDTSSFNHVDATLRGYTIRDGNVYARIDEQEDISSLAGSIGSQVDPEAPALLAPYAILLARADLPDGEIEAGKSYPLVLSQLVLSYRGVNQLYAPLRRYTPEQVKELDNWQHVANRRKAKPFTPRTLAGHPVAAFVRQALRLGGQVDDVFTQAKRFLRGEFDEAIAADCVSSIRAEAPGEELPKAAPEDYEVYWNHYDTLTRELSSDWLNAYMGRAWDTVKSGLYEGSQPGDVVAALRQHHETLRSEWVGTVDAPGVITKLVRAGMAAGQDSAVHHSSADYRAVLRTVDLTTSWDLMDTQSHDFAGRYTYGLIKGLDDTTSKNVAKSMQKWIASGGALKELEDDLYGVFNDRTRAEAIAATESTRVYNEGATQRWKSIGVRREIWETVRDGKVCVICQPLHGMVFEIDSAGAEHPGGIIRDEAGTSLDASAYGGKRYKAPAHTRCRCFKRPDMRADESSVDDLIAELSGDDDGAASEPLTPDFKQRRAKAMAAPVRQALDEWKDELDEHVAELVRVQVKRTEMDASITAQQDALNAHIRQTVDISDEISARIDEYNQRFPTLSDEAEVWRHANITPLQETRAKVYAEADAVEKELKTIRAQQADINASYGRSLGQSSAEKPIKADYTSVYGKKTERRKRSDSALDWLKTTFDGDAYPATTNIKLKGASGRAHYELGKGTIVADANSSSDTYIHEWGHALEDADPALLKRSIEFLESRTQGEPVQSMRRLKPGYAYGMDERAKADGFPDPYVGKIYEARGKLVATEVLSMGLQYLYNDPVEFYRADPDYFRFITAIVKGYIA